MKVVFHLNLVLDELITIRVEDDAQPFNILEAPEPEFDVPLEERVRPVGGMGVHLVKNMVSTCWKPRLSMAPQPGVSA